MALTGQVETQLPHSTHLPSSTCACPSVIEMAETGHAPTQDSHPTHVPESTFALAIEKTSPQKLKTLPDNPGVYLMKNSNGKIIYVGKAVVLKNRVRQYFRKTE